MVDAPRQGIECFFPSVTVDARTEEDMSLRKLTRLVMHQASGEPAALFIDEGLLDNAQREFLKENGVDVAAAGYKFEFPAFYDGKDVDAAKKMLGSSCVLVTSKWEVW
jgi:hypothetical protein